MQFQANRNAKHLSARQNASFGFWLTSVRMIDRGAPDFTSGATREMESKVKAEVNRTTTCVT
jgi:hypothetical protein